MNLSQRFTALLLVLIYTMFTLCIVSAQNMATLQQAIQAIKEKSAGLEPLSDIPPFEIPCDAECFDKLGQLEGLLESMKGAARENLGF